MKRFFFIFFSLLVFDIATKLLTVFFIPKMSWLYPNFPFGGIGIFHHFFGISLSLNYVENTGAAWGMFSHYPAFLFYLRIVIVFFIVIYLIRKRKEENRFLPFLLILAGAIGNIIDTIVYGHVVDMIHFRFGHYSFPVFNIADSMISLGIFLMVIGSFIRGKKWKEATS